MIVVDASTLVHALTAGHESPYLARLATEDAPIVPSHCRAEVANGLRGLHVGGKLPEEQFTDAWRELVSLPLDERPIELLMPRAYELRHNMTALDAFYVALAERLGISVLTSDRRWRDVPGLRCAVELI